MVDWNISKEATALLTDAHVWDMTIPWHDRPESQEHALTRAAAHGYTLASLTVALDRDHMAQTIKLIAIHRAFFLANPDKYVLVDKFSDIERAKKAGKLAIVFHFQGTNPVEGDIKLIELYHQSILLLWFLLLP